MTLINKTFPSLQFFFTFFVQYVQFTRDTAQTITEVLQTTRLSNKARLIPNFTIIPFETLVKKKNATFSL